MKIFYFLFQKKELSTNEQPESNENAKIWYIAKGKTEDKYAKNKKHHNVRDKCYYTGEYRDAVHSICNLKYSTPMEITIIFYNRSSYDSGFIIK